MSVRVARPAPQYASAVNGDFPWMLVDRMMRCGQMQRTAMGSLWERLSQERKAYLQSAYEADLVAIPGKVRMSAAGMVCAIFKFDQDYFNRGVFDGDYDSLIADPDLPDGRNRASTQTFLRRIVTQYGKAIGRPHYNTYIVICELVKMSRAMSADLIVNDGVFAHATGRSRLRAGDDRRIPYESARELFVHPSDDSGQYSDDVDSPKFMGPDGRPYVRDFTGEPWPTSNASTPLQQPPRFMLPGRQSRAASDATDESGTVNRRERKKPGFSGGS